MSMTLASQFATNKSKSIISWRNCHSIFVLFFRIFPSIKVPFSDNRLRLPLESVDPSKLTPGDSCEVTRLRYVLFRFWNFSLSRFWKKRMITNQPVGGPRLLNLSKGIFSSLIIRAILKRLMIRISCLVIKFVLQIQSKNINFREKNVRKCRFFFFVKFSDH